MLCEKRFSIKQQLLFSFKPATRTLGTKENVMTREKSCLIISIRSNITERVSIMRSTLPNRERPLRDVHRWRKSERKMRGGRFPKALEEGKFALTSAKGIKSFTTCNWKYDLKRFLSYFWSINKFSFYELWFLIQRAKSYLRPFF